MSTVPNIFISAATHHNSIKMTKISHILAGSIVALALGQAQAAAVNIDFSQYAPGTAISSLQGVTFAVEGNGPNGTPEISFWGNNGLSNSTSGNYPTGNILDFKFAGTASDIAFAFQNYGSGNGSFYTAYGAGNTVLGTGVIDNQSFVNLSYSGVTELQLNNNVGNSNWIFDVRSFSANVSAVPESSNAMMLLAGLGLFATFARRRAIKN